MRPALAALLLAAAAPAQSFTVVSPAAFATKFGTGNYIPFSYNPVRYQQIHSDLPNTVTLITGLAWRRYDTTSTLPGFSMDVQFDISTAATPVTAPSLTYAANHGPDLTAVVFGGGGSTTYLTVNWPATVAPPTKPAPFEYKVPFLLPFVFRRLPVCWEVRLKTRTAGGGPMDQASPGDPAMGRVYWYRNSPDGLWTVLLSTTSCNASDQTNYGYASVTGTRNSGNWSITFSGTRLKMSSSAVWLLGASTTNWLGIPLPWNLPGSTCTLIVAPLDLGPGLATDSSGNLSHPFTVADSPAFAGVTLYLQWLFLDAGLANGVGTTRARSFEFPDPGAFPPPVAAGAYGSQGLVTEFTVL